ncbi:hypothetical protein DACRYDRAFT_112026 [Dacryopinax primogenitus]|uniref:Uncharacterized protein n=1 Tax=Dacryopinax primogenitus (strain DJM 731) TaxID=1858805 RepID=M5FUV7_DACPD|nr:uncharacterized protein DACRYDRAFT_112026 [Dacryopinax primogenitus]EJT97061.1 hypothetical protein DACRYDRAFT_112026 [Dacryopinax primogenitus]
MSSISFPNIPHLRLPHVSGATLAPRASIPVQHQQPSLASASGSLRQPSQAQGAFSSPSTPSVRKRSGRGLPSSSHHATTGRGGASNPPVPGGRVPQMKTPASALVGSASVPSADANPTGKAGSALGRTELARGVAVEHLRGVPSLAPQPSSIPASIPTAVPSVPSMASAASGPTAPHRRSSTQIIEEQPAFPSWDHPHTPLVFALLPVLTSLFFGRGELVADLFYVLLLWWYLGVLVHAPWELYITALRTTPTSAQHTLPLLFLTLVSPLLGGLLLTVVSRSLTFLPPLPTFSIRLFVLAASVRPIKHLLQLWRGEVSLPLLLEEELEHTRVDIEQERSRAAFNATTLAAQGKEVDALRRQVTQLSLELAKAREEVQALARAVRREGRKAELYRLGMGQLGAASMAGADGRSELAAGGMVEIERSGDGVPPARPATRTSEIDKRHLPHTAVEALAFIMQMLRQTWRIPVKILLGLDTMLGFRRLRRLFAIVRGTLWVLMRRAVIWG